MKRFLWLLTGISLLFSFNFVAAQSPSPTQPVRNERLGIAHISAAEGGTGEMRYQQALTLGAYWNRYPIYWDVVETVPGTFDWQRYDIQVADDLVHNFGINAILLGRPTFRADGDRIQGLNEPIFADGSDFPGECKTINVANPWAVFVYEAVNRYKPGGVLSQQGAFARGAGIRVWEIWNEPDFKLFWSGSIGDYARLLKVAYLAAHHADPEAEIMFAGLLYNTGDNWLARVLKIYQDDPYHQQFNYYMDQVAVHSYSDPWRTGWLVLNVRQTLIAYGIADKPIRVTETGIAVWDDYPGPTWAVSSSTSDVGYRRNRGSQQQQAWFVIQSAIYAWHEGADTVIFHQLYDDCGDQAPGTNFPPNDGSLCEAGSCYGDAHGFFRNLASSVCFAQHPQPGTARPAAQAFKLLAQVFAEPFERGTDLKLSRDAITLQFNRPQNGERIVALWSRKIQAVQIKVPAKGANAQLVSLESNQLITPDEDGHYVIDLPAANPDNYDDLQFGSDAAVGGSPYLLIERTGSSIELVDYDTSIEVVVNPDTIPVALLPTPGSILSARPTTDPAVDTQAPRTGMLPLPEVSAPTFTVSWSGEDNSGIASYTVWVQIDDGTWQPWLETTATSAEYTGEPGKRYAFDVWAVDLAGNWSANVQLKPRATTRVE